MESEYKYISCKPLLYSSFATSTEKKRRGGATLMMRHAGGLDRVHDRVNARVHDRVNARDAPC